MGQTRSTHDAGTQWSVYESSVQAYRGLALSSQSLYLTVGAILLNANNHVPFFAVMALAMITTWYIWFPAIFARCAIADFHKFRLDELFDADGNLVPGGEVPPGDVLNERVYASTVRRQVRARVYDHLSAMNGATFRTMRVTRRKVDVVLPILVSCVWVIFAIYTINLSTPGG